MEKRGRTLKAGPGREALNDCQKKKKITRAKKDKDGKDSKAEA